MTSGPREEANPPSGTGRDQLSPVTYCREAEALERDGRYHEAIATYGRALVLAPNFVEASLGQARLYQWRLGSPRQATAICLDILQKGVPATAVQAAYMRLAQTFIEHAGDAVPLKEATRDLLAVVTDDQRLVALRGLVIALVRDGRYDEARSLGAELLASQGDDAELLAVLGEAITEHAHDLTVAEAYYQRALAIDPLNRGVLTRWLLHLVRVGEPERGHALACRAMTVPPYITQRLGSTPPWDGSDLRGKRVAVDGMVGFGDAVQGARVATILRDAGAIVTVTCRSPQHSLLQTVPGVDRVVAPADRQPNDWYVNPFMGFSLINRSPAALGALVPYVTAAADAVERWKALLPDTGRLKVGLTWASDALDRNNRYKFRSMPFTEAAPLLSVPGVDFYSLQCGTLPRRELQTTQVSHRVRDLADRLTDFMETAAAMMIMDLVITVDTAAAHVAGALGRPTFVLLPYTPSFRWPLNRRDYAWYPTMRTFTQTTPGIWRDPVRELRAELAELARRAVARAPVPQD